MCSNKLPIKIYVVTLDACFLKEVNEEIIYHYEYQMTTFLSMKICNKSDSLADTCCTSVRCVRYAGTQGGCTAQPLSGLFCCISCFVDFP